MTRWIASISARRRLLPHPWFRSRRRRESLARRLIPQPRLADAMPAALDGITVLDFTRLLPGPFCTQLLCNLGAGLLISDDAQPRDDMDPITPIVHDRS